MSNSLIVVMGGANLDIIAVPDHRVLPGDSAPGKVRFGAGGVGRNIAEALSLTARTEKGIPQVELITALGDDDRSHLVRETTEGKGVSLRHSFTFPGRDCPVYAAVMDGGDLLSGVNDMGLLKELTPQMLEDRKGLLSKADMIILDANLEQETLEWLIGTFPGSLFFGETVSAVKCTRFLPLLPKLYGIKPNRKEAEELTGMEIHNSEDALEAAARLHSKGTENVVITLGKSGSVYYSSQESGIIEAFPMENLENINGAGDYYLAGVVSSLMKGESLKAASARGNDYARDKLKGEN